MQKHISIILATIVLSSCSPPEGITNRTDYGSVLNNSPAWRTSNVDSDIAFWSERLLARPGDVTSLISLADALATRFDGFGELSDLHHSDSIYLSLLNHPAVGKAGIYQKLALNAMAKHDFLAAEDFVTEALKTGDQMSTSRLILADIAFERGFYQHARRMLENYKNKNAFAYLVRDSKLLDQSGKLTEAIGVMEKAYRRISGNQRLACWTLSTLGDMYGHAGRVRDSYEAYLDVLHLDPGYVHALKGIAWIAISHDHNTADAREIVRYLASGEKRMPELNLMVAEIASVEGKAEEMQSAYAAFMEMTEGEGYDAMYARHRAIMAADQFENASQCINIAQNEIVNRPSAQSYDLLAWGYYRAGRYTDALTIVKEHVMGKAFEPGILYHTGMILKGAGFDHEAEKHLDDALEGSFELGPALALEVKNALDDQNE